MVRVLATLKENQKTSLLLKYLQGFSFKEIGEILGISPEAAKMKVQRAKKTLCKKYYELYKRGDLDEVQLQYRRYH